MDIILSNVSDKPLYEQISMQVKNLIMTGSLNEGDALPSMRQLAKELHISVITTKRAYEELEREGFIETSTGRGSFVAGGNQEMLREQQLRQVEEWMRKAVELAKTAGIGSEEMIDILQLLYKED